MDNDNKRYIFNAHYVMSLIIPDDPTNGKYPGTEATWSDLYNGGYAYEFSMISTSEKTATHEANIPFANDHFKDLISGNKATFSTSSNDGWDYYEISIPWSCMTNSQNATALEGKEGTVFGFDFTIGLTNVSDIPEVVANGGYDGVTQADGSVKYYGNTLILAGAYNKTAKCLNEAAVIILGGNYEGPIIEG